MKDDSQLMLELAMATSWELDDCTDETRRNEPLACVAAS